MSEVTKDPVPDDYIIPFGKHQGEKIGDVSAGYLLWCLQKDWMKPKYPKMHQYLVNEQDTLLEEFEKDHGHAWGKDRYGS